MHMNDGERVAKRQQFSISIDDTLRKEVEEIVPQLDENLSEFIRKATKERLDRIKSIQCPKCGKINDKFAKFCDQCGLPFTSEKLERHAEIKKFLEEDPDELIKIIQELKSKKDL